MNQRLHCFSCSDVIMTSSPAFRACAGLPSIDASWKDYQVLTRQIQENCNRRVDKIRLQRWSIFRAMRCLWFIFQQQCDTDYLWKSLTSQSLRLFSLTIGKDYFSNILLNLGLIILGLLPHWLGSSKRSYIRNQMQRDFLTMYYRLEIYFAIRNLSPLFC